MLGANKGDEFLVDQIRPFPLRDMSCLGDSDERDPLMVWWSSSPTANGNTRSSSPQMTSVGWVISPRRVAKSGFPEGKVFSDGHNGFDESGPLAVAVGPLDDGRREEGRVMHDFFQDGLDHQSAEQPVAE